jgi:hypothetical protein
MVAPGNFATTLRNFPIASRPLGLYLQQFWWDRGKLSRPPLWKIVGNFGLKGAKNSLFSA